MYMHERLTLPEGKPATGIAKTAGLPEGKKKNSMNCVHTYPQFMFTKIKLNDEENKKKISLPSLAWARGNPEVCHSQSLLNPYHIISAGIIWAFIHGEMGTFCDPGWPKGAYPNPISMVYQLATSYAWVAQSCNVTMRKRSIFCEKHLFDPIWPLTPPGSYDMWGWE